MEKPPKWISDIMQALKVKGFTCYMVGGCVRDSLSGEIIHDWDLSTDARLCELLCVFPQAKIISEKYSVVCVERGAYMVQLATFRTERYFIQKDETISVFEPEISFENAVEKDIARRDFTVNAIACSAEGEFVDIYGGIEDVQKKILKTVGKAEIRFLEDPVRILRGIRLVSEKGYKVDGKTLEAMKGKQELLQKRVSTDRIRCEFERIICGRHASSGLRLLLETEALAAIVGDEAYDCQSMQRLIKNIDKTKQDKKTRLGLFYFHMGEEAGVKAVEHLRYSKEMRNSLYDAAKAGRVFSDLKSDSQLKEFISKVGLKRCEFMAKLAASSVQMQQFSRIKAAKEPIFIKELEIDGNDLTRLGINGDMTGKVLKMLLKTVHRQPDKNNREVLEKLALSYKNDISQRGENG